MAQRPDTVNTTDKDSIDQTRWDAAVIGAGPAGTVAAYRLAQSGHSVLLIEKSPFPRYKVCGGCLNARAVSIMKTTGLHSALSELDGQSIHRFSLLTNKRRVDLDLPEGLAVSRAALDAALARAAVSTGVRFLDGTRATLEQRDEQGWTLSLQRQETSISISTRYVLAAGGLGLKLRNTIKTTVRPRARIGAGALFYSTDMPLEPGVISMAVSRHGYVGMVRVEDGQLNIAAAFDVEFVRRHGTPAEAAAHALASSGTPIPKEMAEATWRGTPPLMQAPSDVAADRLLLIGDAAGYVEPFTGEGMAWAFESGYEAANIVIEHADSPEKVAAQWRMLHRRLFRQSQRRCRIVALGLRHPLLVDVAATALKRHPGLAQPILRRLNEPVSMQRST